MGKNGNGYALISCHLPKSVRDIFSFLGYGCVLLPEHKELDRPVSAHPDMLFYVFPDGKILCDEEYYNENRDLLCGIPGAGYIKSRRRLLRKYPGDILFDALNINNTVYGKTDCMAPEILESCGRTVYVKQGYTLCSTLCIGNAAITSDGGICRALEADGVPTLRISPGGIVLNDYGYGFIGGASAYDERSRSVIFFGDPSPHPDYGKIRDFLDNNGCKILYPEGVLFEDFGGAKFIYR